MKKKIFWPLLTLGLFCFSYIYVYAGTCDDECGDRSPKSRCVFYNGPNDHGVCIGWGDPPIET